MASSLPDDYYALLGVDAGADDEALRVAWRRLAARWHPDRAGEGATARFQQLSAAYTVLSDPVARAAYDRRRRGSRPPAGVRPAAAPAASPKSAAARPAPPAVMLERLCGPLSSLIIRGAAELEEDGFVTLVLSEHEAAQGGMMSISMRVELWCPNCAMKGRAAVRCARCGGRGRVEELFSAWLAVPPGVGGGEVLVPSAELPGMVERVRFRVRLRAAR